MRALTLDSDIRTSPQPLGPPDAMPQGSSLNSTQHLINMLQFRQHQAMSALLPPSYHDDIILTNSSLIFNENYAPDRRAEELPRCQGSARSFLHEARSAPDPSVPPSPGVAGGPPDARPLLRAAVEGRHLFNAECHNGSVRNRVAH